MSSPKLSVASSGFGQEIWKPVVGWEEVYEVSSLGRVRSLDREIPHGRGLTRMHRGRARTPSLMSQGYLGVGLSDGDRQETKTLHRMIAEAFVPNPDNLPYVRHLNDVKMDNRLENLAWGTASDNSYDSVRNGTHRNQNSEKTVCVRGHELSGDNIRRNRRGGRVCVTCEAMHGREGRKKYGAMSLTQDDERHGTTTGYSLYKCRCLDCTKAKRNADKDDSDRRRKTTLPDDDPRHGTYSCYKVWSCRCDRCKRANADYEFERKRRVKNE